MENEEVIVPTEEVIEAPVVEETPEVTEEVVAQLAYSHSYLQPRGINRSEEYGN